MIDGSRWLRELLRRSDGDRRQVVGAMYLRILSRRPTQSELDAALEYASGSDLSPRQAANDLAWALINTKEFLYRH
jgi:hypothetical protein